jgi:hypothetical protein
MKLVSLLFALGLASQAGGATITFVPVPGGDQVDLIIAGVGPSPVGAYDLRVGFDPAAVTVGFVQNLGFLGIPGVDTIETSQASAAELRIAEVSLLSAIELQALQPIAFGLARLSLFGTGSGPVVLRATGIVSDAAGDPITTTFTDGVFSSAVPEPGTWRLLVAGMALVLSRYRRGPKSRRPLR